MQSVRYFRRQSTQYIPAVFTAIDGTTGGGGGGTGDVMCDAAAAAAVARTVNFDASPFGVAGGAAGGETDERDDSEEGVKTGVCGMLVRCTGVCTTSVCIW